MKNYKEMADSVFKKMEIYEEKEKVRKKRIVKITSSLSVIALLLSTSIVWKIASIEKENRERIEMCAVDGKCIDDSQLAKRVVESANAELEEKMKMRSFNRSFDTKDSSQTRATEEIRVMQVAPAEVEHREKALTKTDGAVKENRKEEDKNKSFKENQIVINIGGDWISRCNVPQIQGKLKQIDMVSLDKEGLNSYFGRNVFPKVPEDLEEWEVPSYQVYKKDGGKGETYFDSQVLNYSDKSFKRSVNLELSKFEEGVGCVSSPKIGKFEVSVIHRREVELFRHERGVFSADFRVDGVVYRLVTRGLSEEEMLVVLESLLE